jgi:hypothetical protein
MHRIDFKKDQSKLIILLLMSLGFMIFNQVKGQNSQIMIRKSFQSTDEKGEPASLLATFPNNGRSPSFAINGGIGYNYELGPRSFIKGNAEYNRNTLIEKEQNNSLVSAGFEYYLRPFTRTINGKVQNNNFIPVLNSDLSYVRDIKTDKGSLLLTGEITPFSNTFNKPVPLKGVRMLISPGFGAEYQNSFDTPEAKRDSLQGEMLRGTARGQISFTFLEDPSVSSGILLGRPSFQIYANGIMRYDFVNTTETPDGWHPYLDTGIRIFIYLDNSSGKDKAFSIGINYIDGENPAKGLARQKYWLATFKLQI